jgi:hypothetical protein
MRMSSQKIKDGQVAKSNTVRMGDDEGPQRRGTSRWSVMRMGPPKKKMARLGMTTNACLGGLVGLSCKCCVLSRGWLGPVLR